VANSETRLFGAKLPRNAHSARWPEGVPEELARGSVADYARVDS